MTRGNVRVREAGNDDLDALLALHDELRCAAVGRAAGAPAATVDPDILPERYAALLDDQHCRVILAVDDGTDEPLGMALLRTDPVSVLLGTRALSMQHLVVARKHRRRGAGRALLTAATAYADKQGCEHLVVGLATDGREAHRYFARLGFAPLVTRRVASVASLRRTLGVAEVLDARGRNVRLRPMVTRRGPSRLGARRAVGSPPRGRAV